MLIQPIRWDAKRLEKDRQKAIEIFRRERLEEPLEAYLEVFDKYQAVFEEMLETTVDLKNLRNHGVQILGDDRMLEGFRYLAGPPISTDDLKTVADVNSLNKTKLKADKKLVSKIVELVLIALDRRRFPWISEQREPVEKEVHAAVVASASLIASQRMGTARRHEGKKFQEQQVEDALLKAGFRKVPTRRIPTLTKAPGAGEFCGESLLGESKADFVVRLWDDRVLPLECKVSNSAVNSVKRLNHDAAAKAETWRRDFGETQVVPSAVIGGVYKLEKLIEAQRRGLTLFWAHSIDVMIGWIQQTQPVAKKSDRKRS
ncbi:MAG: XamI family restriction endonuclease [Chthoniobacter sp.]|uniref:XamI family restriction endonuclease n=1 Tax=Chthoniobacter sp. TaxID=2510640 RepID=UPI0032A4E2B6